MLTETSHLLEISDTIKWLISSCTPSKSTLGARAIVPMLGDARGRCCCPQVVWSGSDVVVWATDMSH